LSRWERFKKRFRRTREPEPRTEIAPDALREFVYLDDVSVDSLVASVRGGVLEQITQTLGAEVQSELAGTVGASNPVVTAEVRSRLQTTSSRGLETLRRAGIQARFRELHQIVDQRRLLRPSDLAEAPPVIESVSALRELPTGQGTSAWAIRVDDLHRGGVIEVDVELGTEPLFHLASAMSQILELWPENPTLVGLDELNNAGQIQSMSMMLSRMLGGLVPIRSQALDFEAVDLEGETWLVHSAVLAQLPPEQIVSRRPLEVVGVAAEDQFWKDQRRVLFAGARYRVMARLVIDGVACSWTPVKMVDTFKDLVPGFSEAIEDATRLGKEQMGRSGPPALPATPASQIQSAEVNLARRLVETYGRILGEQAGLQVTDGALEAQGLTDGVTGDLPALGQARVLLDPVTEYVQGLIDTELDPEVVSNARLEAHRSLVDITPSAADGSATQPSHLQEREPALLEVEFVAVYW
jgi:hypothetical protein